MSYVVGSKVKEFNKKKDCNTSGDYVEALSKMIEWHLDQACKRADANGRKTVRASDVLVGFKAADSYVVGSKVKEFNKKKDCNTAGDFVDGLNALVAWYLDMACKRAQSNGRKTVRAEDL
jgi:histone H3/H4